jgi:hypothetical protein
MKGIRASNAMDDAIGQDLDRSAFFAVDTCLEFSD